MREWNNYFIKNNQEILLDLADFNLQEQPEDNLMVTISRAWYNGPYTMTAKPIKSLELHYTIIQFKVHLTPNFFFAQINLHIMWSKSPQKFFDLLESSIFYAS